MTASVIPMSATLPDLADHPEAALIERLRAGSESAYRELYVAYADDVYRVGRRFVYSDAEAEEVVQEVFISAFRYIHRFQGRARLRTWLYRITVNRALKRRRWWTRRREVGADPLGRWQAAEVPADVRARDRQALAAVRRCIDGLEPRKRAVLVLHELEGLDTREIAEILECPRSTVLTRLSRARADLIREARRLGVELAELAEEQSR